MKLFLADGRLGNQIFQYVFLKTIQKDSEKIIVSGFEDLKEVFEINDIVNLNKKNIWIRVFLFRIAKPIFTFLSARKIVSLILINREMVLEKYTRESDSYTQIKGFFNFFTFVKLGFFQSEKFFNKNIVKDLKIKETYINQASYFLEIVPENSYKVFIHIRRGDYENYTVYGKSALLPLSYYKEQIEWFLKNSTNSFFIFLSDDLEFIKKEFKYIKNKIISTDNHFGTDLAIMTLCNSAILSPSSFGWWGSYLMRERDIVLSPKYWLGFNSKIEYHKNGSPSYSKEIKI